MKILITGGTGLVGQALGKYLVANGHSLVVITRNKHKSALDLTYPCQVVEANLSSDHLPATAFDNVDAIVHLAGENIGQSRWTEARKKQVMDSRIHTTKNLLESLPANHNVQKIVMASAVGYYGDQGGQSLTESSPPSSNHKDFLSEVCVLWEAAAQHTMKSKKHLSSIPLATLRCGVVLSGQGGALEKMLTPFQAGVGAVLGSGRQWMSWIHIQDLIQIIGRSLTDSKFTGILNTVAPEPCTNLQLSIELSKTLRKPLLPPPIRNVPTPLLKLLLGEMSTLVLSSQKVIPQRLRDLGYTYQFADLSKALADCCLNILDGDQCFQAEQFIPLPRQKVFRFFSEADNLEKITPPLLEFKIESKSTTEIQTGTEIIYRLKVHGIPLRWKTMIEDWVPNQRFIDNQVSGPYKKWHHTHEFFDLGNGTLMKDTVRYRLPMGSVGQLAAGWFVKMDVNKIFSFRKSSVHDLLLK